MSAFFNRGWNILFQTVPGASRSVFLFLLLALPTGAIIDDNTNGVSDLWERRFNSGNLFDLNFDPQADPDGDGWSNEVEAVSGTNPFDANPPDGFIRPAITYTSAVYLSPATEGGEPELQTPAAVTITWPTLIGKQYTLLVSSDLSAGSWQPVGESIIGDGSETGSGITLTQPDGSSPPALFLRVAVNDIDTDGDGLTDAEEIQLGTNPSNNNITDPNDLDGDGLTNAEEAALGSNPENKDSDNDGAEDGKDAVPTDAAIWWPKTPMPNYAVVETGIVIEPADEGSLRIIDINRSGQILFSLFGEGSLNGVFIWEPATNQPRDVTPPNEFNGMDSDPWPVGIGDDGSHHVSGGMHHVSTPNAIYKTPGGAWTEHVPDNWFTPPPESKRIGTNDLTNVAGEWVMTNSASFSEGGPSTYKYAKHHLVNGAWTSTGAVVVSSWEVFPRCINRHGHLLFSDRIERPGAANLPITHGGATGFCGVEVPVAGFAVPRYVDVVLKAGKMWVESANGESMVESTCPQLFDTVAFSENGIGLFSSGGVIWLNGKIQGLNSLVKATGLSDIQAADISTNGFIAATAQRNSTGKREIVLLAPVEVRGYATKEVDDCVAHIEAPGYVDVNGVSVSGYVLEKKRRQIYDPTDSSFYKVEDCLPYKTEAKSKLKILQMGDDNAWDPKEGGDYDDLFKEVGTMGDCVFVHSEFKKDLDIFRIRLPNLPLPAGKSEHRVKIWTTTHLDIEVDPGAEVDLNVVRVLDNPTSTVKFHETAALGLVPDDPEDDNYPVEGKADGALGDRTYRAVLGGKVKIQWLTAPGSGPKPIFEIPVPAEKMVRATGFLLPGACGESTAEVWFARAKKIYSAIGVDLVYNYVDLPTLPVGVDLDDGFNLPLEVAGDLAQMMPETKALMDDSRVVHALTVDPITKGSIPVFFVNRLNPPPGKKVPAAVSNTPSFMVPSDKAYGGAIFMDSKAYESDPEKKPLESVLAHELSHILLDAGHQPSPYALWNSYFTGKKVYIWWGDLDKKPLVPNPWKETDIIAHRRLCDSMRTRIWKSKYAESSP